MRWLGGETRALFPRGGSLAAPPGRSGMATGLSQRCHLTLGRRRRRLTEGGGEAPGTGTPLPPHPHPRPAGLARVGVFHFIHLPRVVTEGPVGSTLQCPALAGRLRQSPSSVEHVPLKGGTEALRGAGMFEEQNLAGRGQVAVGRAGPALTGGLERPARVGRDGLGRGTSAEPPGPAGRLVWACRWGAGAALGLAGQRWGLGL